MDQALWDLLAERDRMVNVLDGYRKGRIQAHELPLDAHEYYGRIERIERQVDAEVRQIQGRSNNLEHAQESNKTIERAMRERQLSITSEAAATVAFSTVEYNAALNYMRGKAEGYNETRDALIRHNPALEKDLPTALQVDEIQVRQVSLEREETQDKGLAVAR